MNVRLESLTDGANTAGCPAKPDTYRCSEAAESKVSRGS